MDVVTPHARLVGRAEQLRLLHAALVAAQEGQGSMLFLTGEAGIGKTRLAEEFAERAGQAGATVLLGHCIPLVGEGLAYLPLIDAFRSLPDPPDLDRMPGGSQLQLFEAVLGVLEQLATARTDSASGSARKLADPAAVLIFEDVHWADKSTVDLLVFLAHAASDRRLLVVATLRSEQMRPDDPLSSIVTELLRSRRAAAISVDPFGVEELGELLSALRPEPLTAELVAAIHARSEGNPFFAEELLATAARDDHLPAKLRDVLLLHIAQLNATARSALRIIAATGRDTPYRLVASVSSLDEPVLTEALRQAVDHGVLLFDQSSATFRVRHALLAEAIYTTLLPGEREAIHVRLAHALRDEPSLAASGHVAAELAHHWVRAGHPDRALAASIQAARDAEAVYGLAEALRHVDRVLALWPTTSTSTAPPAGLDLAQLDLAQVQAWAAELCDLTGDIPRAVEFGRTVIEPAGATADPARLGSAYERLGTYLLHAGRQPEALTAFRHAVEVVPEQPPSAVRARVLAGLAYALAAPGGFAESLDVATEAIATAEVAQDNRAALLAMGVRGRNLCCLGRTEEGIEQLRATAQRARIGATILELTRTYVMLADALITAGRLQDAIATSTEGFGVARRYGLERGNGVALRINAADAFLRAGEWDRAQTELTAALRTGGTYWEHYPHLFQAQLDMARGEFSSAKSHLEAATHATGWVNAMANYTYLVAELALWEGRPADAVAAVDEFLHDMPGRTGRAAGHEVLWVLTQGLRADVELAQVASVGRDAASLARIRRHARQLMPKVRQASGVYSADTPAWQTMAEAEYARVLGSVDPTQWQAAVAAWDVLQRPYLAAYCRWRYAESLVAARVPAAEAAAPAREAHRVASRLGARPMCAELEQLAKRARLDLVGLVREASAEPGRSNLLGLTEREHEVLELLGRGYTNRDIGAELTISAKTASVHVSNIMRKLNARTRLEAATIAHRLLGPR